MPLEIEQLPNGSTFTDAPTPEELEKVRQMSEQMEYDSLIILVLVGSVAIIVTFNLLWHMRHWFYDNFISISASALRAKQKSSSAIKDVSSKIEKDVQKKLSDS